MAHKIGPAFQRVIAHHETKTALGEALGVSRQHVNKWLRAGFIPYEYVARASASTGGRVSAVELLSEADLVRERIKARREIEARMAAATPKNDLFEGA